MIGQGVNSNKVTAWCTLYSFSHMWQSSVSSQKQIWCIPLCFCLWWIGINILHDVVTEWRNSSIPKTAKKQRITRGFLVGNLIFKDYYLCSMCPVRMCWKVEISESSLWQSRLAVETGPTMVYLHFRGTFFLSRKKMFLFPAPI